MHRVPQHWQTSELATAIKYRVLESGTVDGDYKPQLVARVNVSSAYVAPLVDRAFVLHPAMYTVLTDTADEKDVPDLMWDEYEKLDWSNILAGKVVANAYCVRKGLSRKAQLSIYLSKYILKHDKCILSKAVPRTIVLDTWEAYDETLTQFGVSFRQRLDACLWEVKCVLETETKMWIMKPSATNKGAEVNVIKDYQKLRTIVNEWTDIREWVVQEYMERPLLLRGRKFHIRAYVLAVGCLKVFVYQHCLALSALEQYCENDTDNNFSHITNTFQQQSHPDYVERECVMLLDDIVEVLAEQGVVDAAAKKAKILADIGHITAEAFDAFKGEFSVFQPLPNCFEIYGVDFIVDKDFNVWLLEFNPGPDFKQTGDRLHFVIRDLMADTLRVVTNEFFLENNDTPAKEAEIGAFTKVYDQQWGALSKGSSMKFVDST